MFIRLWQFRPRPDKVAEFRTVYGGQGDWATLFGRARGYLGTELLQSMTDPLTYMTLDRWETSEAWEAFIRTWPSEYAALDRRCESLVLEETHVGAFSWPAA
jgi:heme-degrading monooxygenase HmoA